MTSPRSVRFDDDVLRRLDHYVRSHPGSSVSSVANLFVDEALRAEAHPGITFRPGPTGRRAGLVSGPDVWEVIETLVVLRDDEPALADDALVTATARATGVAERQVRTAVRYYAAYRDEIDERLAAHREAVEQAESAWRAERDLAGQRGHAGMLFVSGRRWIRTPAGISPLAVALHRTIADGRVPGKDEIRWLD